MKRLYLLPLLAIVTNNGYAAAPTLQIHVFEDEPVLLPNTSIAKPDPASALSPARKHNLQVHVFERDPNVRTAKTSSADSTISIKENKPILGYQRAEFYGATGYRQDNLDWSVSGITGTPNILSELEWDNIELATLNIGTTLYFQPNWLLNVDFTYGHIFAGDVQDSDYFGNNRTLEFSRSNNSADEGMTIDASIHAGYKWLASSNADKNIYLTPKVGFSYHSQFFKMTKGRQTVSSAISPPLGRFSGLDSHYDATWYGPWLGLDSEFVINENLSLGLNLEYHYAFFEATANWNLRSDFAHPESFTQEAKGYGLVADINAQYRLNSNLSLTFLVNYQQWQANRDGFDTIFFADGSSLKSERLNDVNWQSFGANIGLTYAF